MLMLLLAASSMIHTHALLLLLLPHLCLQSQQVTNFKANAVTSPPSAPVLLTTSPLGAPTVGSAQADSTTTATATALAPSGVTYTSYAFTATPLNGGPSVTVTSSTPTAAFKGLTPGTQASKGHRGMGLAMLSPLR